MTACRCYWGEQDVGIIVDKRDNTIKVVCEGCGESGTTVTWEAWLRMPNPVKAEIALRLVNDLIWREGVL